MRRLTTRTPHSHPHGQEHVEAPQGHVPSPPHGRTFRDIARLIEQSPLSDWVRRKAVAVFERVARAEGKVHGQAPDAVHFHEVGAVDSIVDIVGACLGLEMLGQPRLLASSVVEGTGFVRCDHGQFPLPAPATLEILRERQVSIRQCDEPHELVTPTGAALLAEFAESFGPMPALAIEKIGYGLGTRENLTRPNVLRILLGEAAPSASQDWETDRVAVLETNLDDSTGELLGAFSEKALVAGALDVFHTPIQMKKNRPGVLLTVLCSEEEADRFSELMLRETSAFGVRRSLDERRKLRREIRQVTTPFGSVEVKLGWLNGGVVQAKPEYEVCQRLAAQANVPLKAVYDAARLAAANLSQPERRAP